MYMYFVDKGILLNWLLNSSAAISTVVHGPVTLHSTVVAHKYNTSKSLLCRAFLLLC